MFGSIGMPELIIGLVVILLLFGAKRVPELARGLGSGVREFKKGTAGGRGREEERGREEGEEQLEASKNGQKMRPSWRTIPWPRRPNSSSVVARPLPVL